jgi:hypothetical protein
LVGARLEVARLPLPDPRLFYAHLIAFRVWVN